MIATALLLAIVLAILLVVPVRGPGVSGTLPAPTH